MRYQNVELHNVCELITDDGESGVRMSRLPPEIRERINPGARGMAGLAAGCEIRGILPEGGSARVVLQALDDNVTPPVVTVYHGCFCDQTLLVGEAPTEIKVSAPAHVEAMGEITRSQGYPFDPRVVRIRLPNIHPIRIVSIEGDLGLPPAEFLPKRTMLAYGSSITHGASSIPPEGSYAAQCARHLGCDLINLGFGGAAHMDAAIAEHIAARDDWDFATFEMGINVRRWPLETFRSAVEHFVATVHTARPDAPIVCIDLFTNDCDLGASPPLGVGFREAVQEIVENSESEKLLYVDGRTILTDPAGLRTDLVHPNDNGMQEMGRNLATQIAQHVGHAEDAI